MASLSVCLARRFHLGGVVELGSLDGISRLLVSGWAYGCGDEEVVLLSGGAVTIYRECATFLASSTLSQPFIGFG